MLHPGAMGAAVGAALIEVGHDVVWLPEGRSPSTYDRATAAKLRGVDDLRGCELVLSIVPPAAAVRLAEQIAGFTGHVVDANAISPQTAERVARIVTDGGATYTDGGIIGPPPTAAGTTRLYLSGSGADEVGGLFRGARIEARVLTEGGTTAASAVKMTYAAWTKISSALVLSARETAAALGVDEALAAEWALSQPDLDQKWKTSRRSAETKGWRWADEMREVAATFAASGQPAGFGEAAAEMYERYPRPDQ